MKIDPSFPYSLKSCVWEITLACPFRCAYCGSGGGKARENELSKYECLDIAGQLSDLGCRRVSLIGGEVFLRPDWSDVVSALTSAGIRVCIITNGYKMTPDIIRLLKLTGTESVAVSLDGPEDSHDAFRQKGSFAAALETINALTCAGIPVSVISAIRADNASRLNELYDIIKKYPVAAWQLQACSPMGNACKNGVDIKFDFNSVMDFAARAAKDSPFPVGVADSIGYYTENEFAARSGAYFRGCSAGLTAVGIDSVGNVRGCESMYDDRFIEGNLRERSLRDIWEDENAFGYNRRFTQEMLTGKCAECEHGKICAGGCRSYNYFANGGKLYESPYCGRKEQKW